MTRFYRTCDCDYCKNTVFIKEKDLIPDYECGMDSEKFLSYGFKCPNCGKFNYSKFSPVFLPIDVQIRLLEKYDNIASEMISLCNFQAEKREIDEKIRRVKLEIENKVAARHEDGHVKKIYDCLMSNDKLIKMFLEEKIEHGIDDSPKMKKKIR